MIDESLEAAAEQDLRAKSKLGVTLAGKYRLDSVLGAGGMATVYAATHRNGKEVAVKLLHPELGQSVDIRRRFLREGYVANHVKHSGAVSVLDDDVTEEGEAFLVMERLEGIALDTLWETRVQVNPACVAAVLVPLLDVMQAAHEKGIVHRDLKPANIFLTKAGEVKVLDFGIARMRDATSAADTMQGEVMGTPSFMAPEQAMGQSKAIDAQTDLWAVGAIGFALIVGEVVHPAENAQQAMVFAATRHVRSLGALAPALPSGIANVFERALAFDKKDRWESADEMRAALVAAACEAYGELPGASVIREAMGLPPVSVVPAEERASHPTMDPESLVDLGSERQATPLALAGPRPRHRSRTATTGGFAARAVVLSPDLRRARLWLAAAMATASVVCISAGLVLRAEKSVAAPAATAPTAAAVAAVESPVRAPEPAEVVPAVASVAVVTTEPSASPPTSSSAHPAKARPSPVASHVPTASSAAKAAPHCSQFVIDPQSGVKRWRLECL